MPKYSKLISRLTICVTLAIAFSSFNLELALTQQTASAVDLMLILDNSCSMFAPGTAGCGIDDALGSDTDYLRVTGATIFAVRTALGQTQPQDRIGAISMGGEAEIVYPLTAIEDARRGLVNAVENPSPKGGTNVIDALRTAYDELVQDPRPSNTPAIVFLTDGVPYPATGQSFSDIESVVRAHHDIPLYVLLLQNQEQVIPEYDAYIEKWKQFQQRVTNVQVYEIPDADELLNVYIQVMADITARPGSPPPVILESGETETFYVSRYAQRVEVTAIYSDEKSRGRVEVRDKSQELIESGTQGVEIFSEPDVAVEVYAAYGPRLIGQTDGDWTVTSVDARISFFVDVRGAYRFDWLSPQAIPGTLPGVLLLDDPVNPNSELVLQFRFVDEQNQRISEVQRISGYVKLPDGDEIDLVVPSGFNPDANGIYHLPFRVMNYDSTGARGRLELYLQSEDPGQPGSGQAIAVQRVWIEADPDAPVVTPTPVIIPTTTPTPTATEPPTGTPSPTPTRYIPENGEPDPPIQGALLISIIVGGVLVLVYVLLRLVLKPPRGFALVQDESRKPIVPLRKKAAWKIWGWWRVTVGPKGNLRVRPKVAEPSGGGVMAGAYQPSTEVEKISVPGMGEGVAVLTPTSGKGKKGKEARKTKKKSVYGYFYRDGERTKFKYDCEYGRGTRTLSDNTVEVVPFGDVQLFMCSSREKLTAAQ